MNALEPDGDDNSIHDTQLCCPWCSYNLTAITSNRCPECGKRFVLARPGSVDNARPVTIESRSMFCPDCGHNNQGFMPKTCANCDRPFSLWQRIFGLRKP
jgi:hypothetical protein